MKLRSATITAMFIGIVSPGLAGRLYAQEPVRDTATVAEVVNGTSFITASGRRIVLLGLRFPPRTLAITEADAKKHLGKLIGNRQVLLVRDTTLDPLAHPQEELFVFADGMMVNVQMLRDGYAAPTTTPDHASREQFSVAVAEARVMERGAWGRDRARPVRCSYRNSAGESCHETTRNLSGRCPEHE